MYFFSVTEGSDTIQTHLKRNQNEKNNYGSTDLKFVWIRMCNGTVENGVFIPRDGLPDFAAQVKKTDYLSEQKTLWNDLIFKESCSCVKSKSFPDRTSPKKSPDLDFPMDGLIFPWMA